MPPPPRPSPRVRRSRALPTHVLLEEALRVASFVREHAASQRGQGGRLVVLDLAAPPKVDATWFDALLALRERTEQAETEWRAHRGRPSHRAERERALRLLGTIARVLAF